MLGEPTGGMDVGATVGGEVNTVLVAVGAAGVAPSAVGGSGMKGVGVTVALAIPASALTTGACLKLQAVRSRQSVRVTVIIFISKQIIYTISGLGVKSAARYQINWFGKNMGIMEQLLDE
jgi:hypothetical protein